MKGIYKIGLCAILASSMLLPLNAQSNNRRNAATTPAQQSAQARPQRPDPSAAVLEVVDRVYNYLNSCTPAVIVDGNGKAIKPEKIDQNSTFQKGDFGINTYEWGVTYSGLLLASEVTGNSKYADYVYERMKVIGSAYLPAKKYFDETGYSMRFTPLHTPKWLDDCGSMTAAMIKATLAAPEKSAEFRPLLNNWFNFVMYKEYRLGDGILARHRPATNSVWLDDMYMGITPIAYMGKLSQKERGDLTQKFYNEAVNQVLLFKKYLWVPEKGYYRHGWIEGMSTHPDYHWARANGWAMLTMCDVLDAIPERTQGRDEILELLKTQIENISKYQAPNGLWHQLIDKTESYLETSASAMFTYCIAHAVNKGWIDRTAYQDIARAGWNGVATQVNEKGQVENTCVGTGLGWTNTFYEGRPVSVYAAHGYGPVLLAGAEIIKMLQPAAPAAGRFPGQMPPGGMAGFGRPQRVEGKPMVFLAGDSTCQNGSGSGTSGLWGWGSFFQEYIGDAFTVDNRAVGGLSSRTFFNGSWPNILTSLQKGDYVIIQFGHNDIAPLNTGRARGTLSGTSDEKQTVVMEKNGGPEDVYTYGHYIRMMVRQAKLRGAIPIVVSPTPQNRWDNNRTIQRFTDTYNAWCKTVAAEEKVAFIDLNEIAADEFNKMGRSEADKNIFADVVHTHENGARFYCKLLSEAVKPYLK